MFKTNAPQICDETRLNNIQHKLRSVSYGFNELGQGIKKLQGLVITSISPSHVADAYHDRFGRYDDTLRGMIHHNYHIQNSAR